MPKLDRALAKTISAKLASIPEDATPVWGKMNRAQLYGHLTLVMRHMLGGGPELPFKGNFVSRHIFRHIILNGIKEIPHNIRLPRPKGMDKAPEPPTATLAEFEAALDAYLTATEKGTAPQAMHPFFGPLTTKEWLKFHHAHFKHHCKQFGVW